MKILSRMLSKRIEPEENPGLDLNDDPMARLAKPTADDSGREKTSRQRPAEDDPLFADTSKPIKAKEEEPEVAGSGWNDADWEDEDWDDDEDWGEEDLDPAELQKTQDKEMLVSEIREAMGSVTPSKPSRSRVSTARPTSNAAPAADGNWSQDDDLDRQALARSQLQAFENSSEDRILEKTETEMTDRETSRRRSAMAHLKAAAAATKADRVLRHVVSRDPSADPEEQSPYRDDLAKVVRPHSAGRPISRVVSRPSTAPAVWDQGAGDEDAALFAAAEEGAETAPEAQIEEELNAAEARRLAELNADDFADDTFAEDRVADDSEEEAAFEGVEKETPMSNEFPGSRFAKEEGDGENAFDAMSDEDFGNDEFGDDPEFDAANPFDVEDDNAPRPSRAVSEAVAFANAPDEPEIPEEGVVRKKIWEMADEVASEVEQARHEDIPENIAEVAATVSGRAGRSAGRVKTRLLGFQADDGGTRDVFAQAEKEKDAAAAPTLFPAGWIVVIEGPGRGSCFTVHTGVSQIGRGEDQAVRLDFGDTSISRNNHAAVAYDDEQGKFFLGHGGKSNLVRLNGMPVLSTEAMTNGDTIRIGETTLKFVAMCGEEFTWSGQGDDAADA